MSSTVLGRAEDPVWTPRQALLVRCVDELHDTSTVSDELWGELASVWGPAQLVELVTLVGQYHTVGYVTNALGVELESFAPRYPGLTDGAPPSP